MTGQRLDSILILEDEALVSLMLEDLVRGMGARVIDVFAAASEALHALSRAHYDRAILDVIVRDGTSNEVADTLAARGIPFLFSSGVGVDALEPQHRDRPLVPKPYEDATIRSHILDLVGIARRP